MPLQVYRKYKLFLLPLRSTSVAQTQKGKRSLLSLLFLPMSKANFRFFSNFLVSPLAFDTFVVMVFSVVGTNSISDPALFTTQTLESRSLHSFRCTHLHLSTLYNLITAHPPPSASNYF
jgi:hypothetical protein